MTASAGQYVTTAEADTYLASRSDASAWAALSSAQKTALLREATQAIDALPLRGQKYDSDQDNEFPRVIDGVMVEYDEDAGEEIVPEAVERATCLEAFARIAKATDLRAQLKRAGVKSFNIGGKISETFSDAALSPWLYSSEAEELLLRYTGVELG